MWTKLTVAAALAGALMVAAPALAADPPKVVPTPAKPVPTDLYTGRWYEIARTPNKLQGDCQGATNDFANWKAGAFQVVETCHKGALTGPAQVYNASGRVLSSDNARMKLGFMGGLISMEYWILDRADNDDWAIMDRHDGRYVWLLSRKPTLSPEDKAQAMAKLQQLGFNTGQLAFPQQQ
ncbi:MAG TPA: lipocalin family protein [Caulobacteraceae bacterium]|jgi:apolipoprotein D and lipocalin family protein